MRTRLLFTPKIFLGASLGVGALCVQGVALRLLLVEASRITKQREHLVEMIYRNADRLDESTLVNLQELGLTRLVQET
jgi:hypothetical protein